MSKYNDELVGQFIAREMGTFIKENHFILSTTVGETILIIQATTAYIDDMLQGTTTKEQRSLVVNSTLDHTKKLMLAKVGHYEETEDGKKNDKSNRRTRRLD